MTAIVGQRVVVKRLNTWGAAGNDPAQLEGQIVGYVMGVAVSEGFVEERCRVVVETDAGRIVFAIPSEVSVLAPVAVG